MWLEIKEGLDGDFCLLIRSATFSYGFLRKSGHAHYSMLLLQQNPPLAFGRTMLWKWLKRSCLQCTLQAAHFSLAFSLLLLKFMPITWKTLISPTIVIFFAFSSYNRYDWSLSDESVTKGHANPIKTGKKAVSIDRMLLVKYQTFQTWLVRNTESGIQSTEVLDVC